MDYSIFPISALKDNYIWAIVNNHLKTAFIVDPGEVLPVFDFLNQHQLKLAGILITHHHWDHCAGAAELASEFSVPVYGSSKETVAAVTYVVKSGDVIQLEDGLNLQVMAIPGHTLDHVAYHGLNNLFCGDTLFSAGCGRLFEGTAEQLYHSLQTLAALPDNTKIYCGHEYTLNNLRFAKVVEPNNQLIDQRIEFVTELLSKKLPSLPSLIKEEKETNPFLRCQSEEIILNVGNKIGRKLSDPIEVFTELRKWKDRF